MAQHKFGKVEISESTVQYILNGYKKGKLSSDIAREVTLTIPTVNTIINQYKNEVKRYYQSCNSLNETARFFNLSITFTRVIIK